MRLTSRGKGHEEVGMRLTMQQRQATIEPPMLASKVRMALGSADDVRDGYVSINDLSINPGQTASITGQITGAQQTAIPEPATMFLLSTGFVSIAAGLRRRRSTTPKLRRQFPSQGPDV